jgi:hypothetical protein
VRMGSLPTCLDGFQAVRVRRAGAPLR